MSLKSVIEPNHKNIALKSVCCVNWEVTLLEAEYYSCLRILNADIWILLENSQKVVGALYYRPCSQIVHC